MRTTLTIDDDVLDIVKERAKREGRTAGEVLSDLARRELTRVPDSGPAQVRNGFPLLPRRGEPVTNACIDRIREEEGL